MPLSWQWNSALIAVLAGTTFFIVALWAEHSHVLLSYRSVVLKPWPARPSGVAREAIFIGKKT